MTPLIEELIKLWEEYLKYLDSTRGDNNIELWRMPIQVMNGEFDGFMIWLKSRKERLENEQYQNIGE